MARAGLESGTGPRRVRNGVGGQPAAPWQLLPRADASVRTGRAHTHAGERVCWRQSGVRQNGDAVQSPTATNMCHGMGEDAIAKSGGNRQNHEGSGAHVRSNVHALVHLVTYELPYDS